MKLDNFYHLVDSDYRLHLYYYYIHNISADASMGLLQVFHVKLGKLDGTLNRALHLI